MAAEISTALFPDESDSRGWFFPIDAAADDESVAAHEKNVAGCNLILLGIGPNGHIAFNEPGTPFSSRSHFAALAPETRAAHAARFRGGRSPRARAHRRHPDDPQRDRDHHRRDRRVEGARGRRRDRGADLARRVRRRRSGCTTA